MTALAAPTSAPFANQSPRAKTPWRWSQTWRNVLFLHWEVAEKQLAELLPTELEPDRWRGTTWVSAVAFHLARVQLRGLPPVPFCTDFLELNLRTYVRYRGEPGIYFLSMHADSRIAVAAARTLTPLPYRYAPLSHQAQRPGWRWRCGGRGTSEPVLLDAYYEERGAAATLCEGSLDAWLLERYAAFVPDRRGGLNRMVCDHAPWQVQTVACDIAQVCAEPAIGIPLDRLAALGHFASGVEARIGSFERLG
ncbi:MAG: DUF2071 domain-containing protein [Planctomycetaceae bacterium]|nr:DUF2071 domain-containing protein [Planctomycetaceae bacterium]